MAVDPYETLGVSRTATADEIRRAYRKLAKQNHPDLNPGNKPAEDKFKAIATAYDLLSDTEKRQKFDRGEIDGTGEPRYQAPPGGFRGGGAGFPGGFPGGEDGEYEDFLSEFMHRADGGQQRPQGPRKGRDRGYTLAVDFLDAVNGATQRLSLPDGGALEVRIPPGIEEGQSLRLKEKGEPGRNGGPAGDALIEISVKPHKSFRRDGANILVDLPVTLAEAVLGGKVAVPTTTGAVTLSIPANSANGAKLRLRGRGVPAQGSRAAGDQYVTLQITLDPADKGLADYLRDRTDAPEFDPRA